MTPAFRPTLAPTSPDSTVELVRQTLCDLLELVTAGEPISARLTFRGVRVRLDAAPQDDEPPEAGTETQVATLREQMADFREEANDGRGPLYSAKCAESIVNLLRTAGKRMTMNELADKFFGQPDEWSYSAISHTAPVMMREGVLDSKRDARGKGYGLPEWSENTGDRYSPRCAEKILEVLSAVGHRLSLTEISDEFSRRGIEWSPSTVQHTGPAMRRRGELTNGKDDRGAGYGLPEWTDNVNATLTTEEGTPS